MPQGLKTFAAQIFVEIGRSELAAILGGHMSLAAQKRGDLRVAHVERVPQQRIALLVAEHAVEPRETA